MYNEDSEGIRVCTGTSVCVLSKVKVHVQRGFRRNPSLRALSPRKLISEGSRLCARMHLVLKDIFDMTDILC